MEKGSERGRKIEKGKGKGKEKEKEKGKGKRKGKERWKEDRLRKVGCTHARMDTKVIFILCIMLCIALDGQKISKNYFKR